MKFICLLLSPADHSSFTTSVALCLGASLAVLALAAAFHLFKVDIVLAYRKLLRHFTKERGKFFLSVEDICHFFSYAVSCEKNISCH